jgi:hypothetical protein
VRQRSLFADLIFCFFLIKQKEEAHPRRLSGRILLVVRLAREMPQCDWFGGNAYQEIINVFNFLLMY